MRLRFVLGIGLAVLFANNAKPITAYVSNEKSNTVSKIDTDSWKVTKTIRVGQRPRGIAYTKDQKYVLVACGDDDTIQLIDTQHRCGRRLRCLPARIRSFSLRHPTASFFTSPTKTITR